MSNNLAVICDITNNSPIGVICCNPKTGDIAYSTQNKTLSDVLEIILDNKVFLLKDEVVNNNKMIVKEIINKTDSYYLTALNYSLPFPWRIFGVTEAVGDVEEIIEQASNILDNREENQNEK